MSKEITVSDDIYNDVQMVSERLGLTPEEFISEAAEKMILKNLTEEEIIARISKVCETEDTSMDPVIAQLQAKSIGQEEW